ncbi:hypothetical protein RIF25_00255 [Thermosynechococcaceae cyanobacterium BACA0444]|uniref:Uncharacterized protein n=1 Tax=Pseudocalidococcus azoricus BACA0444 TaxID=2918990 RepID=A0AAE4JUP0_9CYAN|nr:hypothetical protein [Pseudocalidococcus azoricus]MDS3859226.1 hypothetical protein [Pseudocalidococcus azoricus BACA0444]
MDTKYTLFGAMHLDDDTFWHIGLQITLFTAPNEYPQQPVLIRFMLKAENDGYRVKITQTDKGHLLHAGNDAEFSGFFNDLQQIIRKNFEVGLQHFLEQSASLRTIGFVQ